jgi:hypothetical protein
MIALYTFCACDILQNMELSGYCRQKYKVCLSLQFLQTEQVWLFLFYLCIVNVNAFLSLDQQADSELPGHGLFSIFSKLCRHSPLTSIKKCKTVGTISLLWLNV